MEVTLHGTQMYLRGNRVLGRYVRGHLNMSCHLAVRHSLTIKPETALRIWMAAWR
jgi:hypothetical protein